MGQKKKKKKICIERERERWGEKNRKACLCCCVLRGMRIVSDHVGSYVLFGGIVKVCAIEYCKNILMKIFLFFNSLHSLI